MASAGDVGKVVFLVGWFALQGALVVTARSRPDGAFGFRMFSESSTLEAHLFRTTRDGVRTEVPGGEWVAKDLGGTPHRFAWSTFVKEPNLSVFGVTMHASYGVAAQVQRWSGALEYVARHLPDDQETRRLELELMTRHNGRDPVTTRLVADR